MKQEKVENQDIEFKQNWQDDYLKWICAFANTNGGTLYIGVNDDGSICGVSDYKKLSESIPLKIKQTMGLLCDVTIENDDSNLKYLVVKVAQYATPVSYHGKYYKRVGSTTQEVSGFELNDLILKAHGLTWDAVTIPNVTVSDLDERAFKVFRTWATRTNRFKQEALEISNEALLQNLRAFDNKRLTRAAIMAFHPDPEKWVINAYTKIGYFLNDADILYQDEVHGSLLTQVEDALDLIYTKYMKALISYPDQIHRWETFFFPRSAFRELLLNSLIHKDYSQPYPIQILIYKDKIEIWNIGEMPKTIKIEELYHSHHSVPRNPKIADIFFKCGLIESWGRGYYKIKTICQEENAKLPEPKNITGGVSVICSASDFYLNLAKEYNIDRATEPNQMYDNRALETSQVDGKNDDTDPDDPLNDPLNEIARRIIKCIRENHTITTREIADVLNVSEKTVKRSIAELKAKSILKREGSKKTGYWKIIVQD